MIVISNIYSQSFSERCVLRSITLDPRVWINGPVLTWGRPWGVGSTSASPPQTPTVTQRRWDLGRSWSQSPVGRVLGVCRSPSFHRRDRDPQWNFRLSSKDPQGESRRFNSRRKFFSR